MAQGHCLPLPGPVWLSIGTAAPEYVWRWRRQAVGVAEVGHKDIDLETTVCGDEWLGEVCGSIGVCRRPAVSTIAASRHWCVLTPFVCRRHVGWRYLAGGLGTPLLRRQ